MAIEPLTEAGPAGVVEVDAYNQVAIDFAARLNQVSRDKTTASASRAERPLDQLVPPFNRAALGVQREYERMGNQPVSDALLARAESVRYRV